MKNSTLTRSILIVIFLLLVVMASSSMDAADNTEKKIVHPAKIHTALFNQFNTSVHYQRW